MIFFRCILISIFFSICLPIKKVYVQTIEYKGNASFQEEDLSSFLRLKKKSFMSTTEFKSNKLNLDLIDIQSFYKSKGFLDASVKESYEIQDQYADLIFKINEGKRYFLSDVNVSGNNLIDREEIIEFLGMKSGYPYNPVAINDNLYLLENKYHNMGKLFFSISIQVLPKIFFKEKKGKENEGRTSNHKTRSRLGLGGEMKWHLWCLFF